MDIARSIVRIAAREYGIDFSNFTTPLGTGDTQTFVGATVAIKINRLSEGICRFEQEAAAHELLLAATAAVPRVLGRGQVTLGVERWAYIVFERMPGIPLGGIGRRITPNESRKLATYVGDCLNRVHSIEVPHGTALGDPTKFWPNFLEQAAVHARDAAAEWCLPAHLIEGLDKYIDRNWATMRMDYSCLLHGDIHDGNLLVHDTALGIVPSSLIDFDRALIGDPAYDLSAVHVRLTRGWPSLFRLTRTAGPMRNEPLTSTRMMLLTILHNSGLVRHIFHNWPTLSRLGSWEEVAEAVWTTALEGCRSRPKAT